MSQLLELSWWFSFFGTALPWWLFCVVASVAALPLALRAFRGLADGGASLSHGVGLIAVNMIAWVFSLESLAGNREAFIVRAACAVLSMGLMVIALLCVSRQYVKGLGTFTVFFPAVLLFLLALIPLPHGPVAIYFALLLLAVGSVACWLHDVPGLVRMLRRAAVPFLFTQVLFFVAFLFFVNVRSYLPWATFELSLHQAEKWGNFTHLGSVMASDKMPPKDLWFNGEPTNYYYGGHLLVGIIAKATGTDPRVAFNLGLATVFALTITMGFGFVFALVHLVSRKSRPLGPVVWHSGMAWGVFGALAIGMFGNLDAWRQLLTREMDGGVQIRWERREESAAEDWKVQFRIPPEQLLSVQSAVRSAEHFDKPQRTVDELNRVSISLGDVGGDLDALIKRIEEQVETFATNQSTSLRRKGDDMRRVVRDGGAVQVLKRQNGVNAVELQERAAVHIHRGEFDAVVALYREAARKHRDVRGDLESLSESVRSEMDRALDAGALRAVLAKLSDAERAAEVEALLRESAVAAHGELNANFETRNFAATGRTLEKQLRNAMEFTGAKSDFQQALQRDLRSAIEAFAFDPMQKLSERFGGEPRIARVRPDIRETWLDWPNVAFVDFWAPSRAIKGTPPGVREPGTITEFPYFSAILGDLHPHHMAIPFCLAALCACLSLLRKNSRLKRDDATFFRRSWPDLLAMAFFIGAVFPVNTWDAVVLAPLYGLVIIVARRGIDPSPLWRWVGFAGFIVLLAMVASIPFNSMPGITPLFQKFPFFLLAVAVLAAGIPALAFATHTRSPWIAPAVCVAVAILLIVAGPFLSMRNGGESPDPALRIALRDLLAAGIIASIAAMWTLGKPSRTGNWWYSAGGVYALVGGLSLAVILPFKLTFHAPLQPEGKIFAELLPPVISHELKMATNRFWETFWKSSPVNPFDQALRTQLRDFMVHWGIFFFPILFLAIGRVYRASRLVPQGVTFMVCSIALAFLAFGRNYLGYWAGSISLAMMVFSIYFACVFSRRAESPAWTFLAVAFFWTWFVEALHFDDDYAGNYERYNTPFKIYYPIWAVFAGGMVVALRELFARRRIVYISARQMLFSTDMWTLIVLLGVGVPVLFLNLFPELVARTWFLVFWAVTAIALIGFIIGGTSSRPSRFAEFCARATSRFIVRWPAMLAVFAVGFLGMYYPFSATATRTREFFTWPIYGTWEETSDHRTIFMDRTLDALVHLGSYPKYAQDYKAFTWARENVPAGSKLLERAGDVAYSHIGRMSTGSGHTTVLGWRHHQSQWRGRAKAAPTALKYAYYEDVNLPAGMSDQFRTVLPGWSGTLEDETVFRLRMANGGKRLDILRELFPAATLEELYRLRRVVEKNDVTMGHVMDSILAHVRAMYTEGDRNRVAELMDRYDIDYVVFGRLEQDEYGAGSLVRFLNWGFETVYNSLQPQHALPLEPPNQTDPTYILKVPDNFLPEAGAQP